MRVLICAFLMALSTHALSTELTFKRDGKTQSVAIEKLANVTELKVMEPHEQKPVTFKVVSLEKVLDSIYGRSWRSEEELLVTCSDGYQPSLPVQLLKDHKAYLAFAKSEGAFVLHNTLQNNERVDLGPLYLVWDNKDDKAIQSQGASVWPYQVTQMEFVRFADRFAGMAPPAQSPAAVNEGFLAFRQYCQSCHRINGQGGEKSLELNYPVNVTEYYRLEFLEKWIDAPDSIRFGSLMPALSHEVANRNAMISKLIAYLRAMKDKKIKPVVK